jgi:hypothetical protein
MILYRYMRAEHALLSLRGGYLRAASVLSFNDPFEASYERDYGPDVVAAFLSRLRSDPVFRELVNKECMENLGRPLDASMIEALPHEKLEMVSRVVSAEHANSPAESLKRHIDKWFAIICFSEVRSDELMWAHYADSHMGVVLGFNVPVGPNGEMRAFIEGIDALHKVQYSDKAPKLPGLGVRKEVEDVKSAVLTKSSKWSYEREWRAFISRPKVSSAELGSSMNVCYDPTSLAEIVLGCRIAPTSAEEIMREAANCEFAKPFRCVKRSGYNLSVEAM